MFHFFINKVKQGKKLVGFLRVQCTSCNHEKLVAFSCKKRGFCPSCGARRMTEAATHLVDDVFPEKPMRQWVLTFPFQLRFLFARDHKVMGKVLGLVNRTPCTFLIKKAGFTKKSGARTGSVTFIQRFGGSLNLNIHFHMMFPDGVYSFEDGRPKFLFTPPPSNQELENSWQTLFTEWSDFWKNGDSFKGMRIRFFCQNTQASVSTPGFPQKFTRGKSLKHYFINS